MGHPASISLPDDEGVVGRVVANRYLIESPCERTAASSIYRAQYLLTDRTVLLRVLPARPGLSRELCRDVLSLAERAGSLSSPHVARTLDVGVVADRWPFIVSEYSKGRTLASLLAQHGPLGLGRVLAIARQLASALACAHRSRLAHGPLQPEGIWVESPGGRTEWVRLLDFGLSELSEHGVLTSGSGVFPSGARNAGDGFSSAAIRADIRSLGCIMFQLASGSAVNWATSDVAGSLDAKFVGAGWSGERALVRGLALVVKRCLGLVPDTTYTDLNEACADLEALADTALAIAPGPEPAPPITTIHAPARRACVALGGPKVIVRG